MNKKNTKIKRAIALLGVVVALVSLFAVPASAWELTDIPFYNYFDVSKVSGVSASWGGKVTSVDPENGTVTMSGTITESSQICMVFFYEGDGRTLREFCPEMVVGESYVLTAISELAFGSYGSTSSIKTIEGIGLADENNQGVVWYSGETLQMTEELLSRRVYFYVGKSVDDAFFEPCVVQNTLQVWINKDEAYDFCPYDIGKELEEKAYNQGFYDGANYVNPNKFVRLDNTTLKMHYKDASFGGIPTPYVVYNSNNPFPFEMKGYSLNTRDLPSEIKNKQYKGVYSHEYCIQLDLMNDYIPEGVLLYYEAINCTVKIVYVCTLPVYDADTGTNRVETRYVDALYVEELHSSGSIPLTSLFGGSVGDRLIGVEIYFTGQSNWGGAPIHDGSISFVSSDNPSFVLGSEEGYNKGLGIGKAEGLKEGFNNGHEVGYNAGLRDGYANGKEDGYYQGRSDEQDQSTFFSLIYSVLDAPVKVLGNVLNFEIMGVNMMGLASSLVTFAILVTVVKYFV